MTATFVQLNTDSRLAKSRPIGYIIRENGCWEWKGSTSVNGYGRLWSSGRMVPAHRYLYEMCIGPIPDGLELDHFRCDNRSCVNPEHVRPVSHRENLLRGNAPSSGRAAQTHCLNGHPLVGDNLMPYDLKRGRRMCRTCHNERARQRHNANPEARNAYQRQWRATRKQNRPHC